MNTSNQFDPPQPFSQQANQHQQPNPGEPHPFQGQPLPHAQQGYAMPPVAPEPPKKNWFARHKVLTGIGSVVALIIVISALGGGGNDDAPPTAKPTQSAAPDSGAKESPATDPQTEPTEEETQEAPAEPEGYRIGDVATVGDMTYKVLSVDTAATVGPPMFESKAKGTYLVVKLEVTNNGNEAILVSDSFFTLTAGEKKFDTDSSASLWANTGEDGANNSFLLENLNPDLTMSGVVVFDVSEAVASAPDNILNAQTGFFGTQTVQILLAN